MAKKKKRSLRIGGKRVKAGTRARIDIPVSRLATGDWLSIPVEVINGVDEGAGCWLSGAIHGDEVIGVAVIHRVVQELDPESMSGHVIAAPIVNGFGFLAGSRYLPDRRDLNRSFPGRKRGSLASQLARLFMKEVVGRCGYGIDIHAGSGDRTNLPQLRANLKDAETDAMAVSWGAPIMIHNRAPKGSLRRTAAMKGKKVLLYEGGEPRRFEEEVVEVGVRGVLRVLRHLDICSEVRPTRKHPVRSFKTRWMRAPRGGIFWLRTERGRKVRKGQRIGVITGPYGDEHEDVKASIAGMVVGHSVNPLVNRGDALVHIAELEKS